MHIAILDEELPFPLNSGKRIRTFNLLRELAGRHRITYLCHRNADPKEASQAERKFRDMGITPHVVERTIPLKSGFRFYSRLFANLFSSLPYSVATHRSAELRHAVEELSRTDPPDLWHCEWTPYAETLREPLGPTPIVVMAHNVESLIWQRFTESEANSLKRWYLRQQWKKFEAFEKWAYRQATRTIAVSEEDAHLIRNRFGATRVEVVDNGVDPDFFHENLSIPRDPFQLLFLGSLDWRPNLDGVRLLLDQLFPKIREREPRAKLILAGRKPPEWLRERIKKEPQVELHADLHDVRPLLWQSGLLVVPLRIGGGSRLKILEALATGLPVVTTEVGVEGLRLQDGEHLSVATTLPLFCEKILGVMSSPESSQAMAQRGRESVLQEYRWTNLALRLEKIWLDCLNIGSKDVSGSEDFRRPKSILTQVSSDS